MFVESNLAQCRKAFSLVDETLDHIRIQAGEVGQGGHPDDGIRRFNIGLNYFIEEDSPSARTLKKALVRVALQRDIGSTHFADLLARSTQYVFRQRGDSGYVGYSPKDWEQYFETFQDTDDYPLFIESLKTRSVATNIPERYRALAAVSAKKCQDGAKISVIDLGSSLNLGLLGVLAQTYLLGDSDGGESFTDQTSGVLRTLLKQDNIYYNQAIGVELQEFKQDHVIDPWVLACAYFTKYDAAREKIESINRYLQNDPNRVNTVQADITDPDLPGIIQRVATGLEGQKFDIIHASMVLYQLSPQQQEVVLENAAALLGRDGIFMELTFIDPKNWFATNNVVTTIRFMQDDGKLSDSYEWIRWDSSRCRLANPGADFETVNQQLYITAINT